MAHTVKVYKVFEDYENNAVKFEIDSSNSVIGFVQKLKELFYKITWAARKFDIYLVTESNEGTLRYYDWFNLNNLHRVNGPAIEFDNGDKTWYKNGLIHREDGPARVYANGNISYYIKGERHREDGPAIIKISSGYRAYYNHNNLHRTDGPAVIKDDTYVIFALNGRKMNASEFSALTGTHVPDHYRNIDFLRIRNDYIED